MAEEKGEAGLWAAARNGLPCVQHVFAFRSCLSRSCVARPAAAAQTGRVHGDSVPATLANLVRTEGVRGLFK